jgi:two-component SAPR family response regulator
LWAGDGREGRQKAFDVTVARLRRLLGHDAAVGVSDRRVRLAEQCVWTDVRALNDRLAEGESAPEGSSAACVALEATLALYRGPFLADSREAWVAVVRDRLRSRFAAALLRATRHPGVDGLRRREWILRANAADPCVTELIAAA